MSVFLLASRRQRRAVPIASGNKTNTVGGVNKVETMADNGTQFCLKQISSNIYTKKLSKFLITRSLVMFSIILLLTFLPFQDKPERKELKRHHFHLIFLVSFRWWPVEPRGSKPMCLELEEMARPNNWSQSQNNRYGRAAFGNKKRDRRATTMSVCLVRPREPSKTTRFTWEKSNMIEKISSCLAWTRWDEVGARSDQLSFRSGQVRLD